MRVIRFSGLPVSPENLAAYNEEWKAGFDAVNEEHGNDMLEVHKALETLEKELQLKYVQIEAGKLPTSKKGWKALLDKFEAPVMIAKSLENPEELIMVIIDQPIG